MANSPYTLFTQQASGPTLTAGTVASIFVGSSPAAGQNRGVIPANWMGNGTMFTVEASGTLITAATPGTGLWGLAFGATAIWTPTATTLTASMTTWAWNLHYDFEVRTIGATTQGTVWGSGYVHWGTAASGTLGTTGIEIVPFVGAVGFDTTVPNTLDILFTESVATATLICTHGKAIIWNPNY